MKGLLKYLSPFAPDQSGATSVFFEFGGITVICDAGGCTGNICGFDEPRWFDMKSALFSAGLRDMDAILGRDDKMIAKLADTASKVDAKFAALIGTPVPAVIATDFKALKRMAEKKCHMPVLTVTCTGTRLYDEGASEAWLELFRRFADEPSEIQRDDFQKSVGILGLTPLDTNRAHLSEEVREYYRNQGYENVLTYGMGDGLEAVRLAGTVSENIVTAPSGLAAARYLRDRFGIPFRCEWPFTDQEKISQAAASGCRKILILHQQVAANTIRCKLQDMTDAQIVCGTFFMQDQELMQQEDVHFETEDGFISYVMDQKFDMIIADQAFKRPLKDFGGAFIHMPHFAVSGELEHDNRNR